MLVKIDVRQIVKDHLETLADYSTQRRSGSDVVLFFGIPAVLAIGLVAADQLLSSSAANVLITALAIFTGLLFNLLLLAHGMLRSSGDPKYKDERDLIREVYSNISYSIFIALVAIIVLLSTIFPIPIWAARVGSAVIYFLVLNFLLTLLMVLKRVHVLLAKEFKRG